MYIHLTIKIKNVLLTWKSEITYFMPMSFKRMYICYCAGNVLTRNII